MSKTINFVGERRKKLDLTQRKDYEILKKVVYVFVAVFAVFLIALGTRLYYVFQVRGVLDEQDTIRQVISSQQQTELDYNVFAQKLKQLTELFGVRKDKQEAFEFFSQVFGPEVIISEIDYSSSSNDILQFTVQAPSVFVMEQVFETLDSPEVKGKFAGISKSGLSRSGQASYNLTLTVILATPGGPIAEDPNAPATNQPGEAAAPTQPGLLDADFDPAREILESDEGLTP